MRPPNHAVSVPRRASTPLIYALNSVDGLFDFGTFDGLILCLVLVQINLRLEERPGQAIPKPCVAITPASPYAFTVTFMQVVTLPCPRKYL